MTFFDRAYEGVPPRDTGRPQPAIVTLDEAEEIGGAVLDAGCGTGENALFLASRGHEVVGVDTVPRAVEIARAKARERGMDATFLVGDVLDLSSIGRRFDTIVTPASSTPFPTGIARDTSGASRRSSDGAAGTSCSPFPSSNHRATGSGG